MRNLETTEPEGVREIGLSFLHPFQKGIDQGQVIPFLCEEAELAPHAGEPVLLVNGLEPDDGIVGQLHRLLFDGIQQGQKSLGKPGQIPLGDEGLPAVGVAAW